MDKCDHMTRCKHMFEINTLHMFEININKYIENISSLVILKFGYNEKISCCPNNLLKVKQTV